MAAAVIWQPIGLIRHKASGLFVAPASQPATPDVRLVLQQMRDYDTKSGAFALYHGCLVHIPSLMFVHPIGGIGMRDVQLCLHPDGPNDRIRFTLLPDFDFLHLPSGMPVHPFGGRGKNGVAICLHPDRGESHQKFEFVPVGEIGAADVRAMRVEILSCESASNPLLDKTVQMRVFLSTAPQEAKLVNGPVYNASFLAPRSSWDGDVIFQLVTPESAELRCAVGPALDSGIQVAEFVGTRDNFRVTFCLSRAGGLADVTHVKNHYTIYKSTLAGTITHYADGAFLAYQLALFGVASVFGDVRCPWNVNYKAAQKIFQDSAAGATVRAAVRAQHAHIYRDGGARTQRGAVRDGPHLLEVLEYGLRGGKHIIFTFVMFDDVILFSETGKEFVTDFMSKHAMHANAAEFVRISGEMYTHRTPEGEWELVLDNNSGTYAPPADRLPLAVEVMRRNFPALSVRGVAVNTPEFHAIKEQVAAAQY